MKKLLITILALVYLTVSSGATVNLHYCMGKLMSWDLSLKATINAAPAAWKRQVIKAAAMMNKKC